eukprot:CAMPEP_0170545530 /NCGR_PEP_ID=MMETSP0211-20121228/3932_1 /TAXON_ID=311385 /ORGANISM="Pseudokeronopsis sp., Strain OXSARD2" /LENGTH=85 /DNA_ID=CAMNT_0010849503 /DNA_START=22 /DNA_END=276 /DNA_ORIENTATION=-
MTSRNSEEWDNFIAHLERSKNKCNKDVLCTKCWTILKHQHYLHHKRGLNNHSSFLLTSRYFADERKFVDVARKHGKVWYSEDDEF